MLKDILNKNKVVGEAYGLSTDFAEVISDLPNGMLRINMLQREGVYDDVLFVGFQKPSPKTQGVVVFVGKTKYPVFIPINKGGQKSGTYNVTVTEEVTSQEPSDPSKFEQYDSNYPYFNFNGGTSLDQRWVMPSVHSSLKLIARDWYQSPLNPTNKKLFLGDGSTSNGRGIRTSHSYGTQVDVYVDAGAEHIESDYSFDQIIGLIEIFKKYGVKKSYFDPRDREKFRKVVPEFVRYAYAGGEAGNTAHRNHFHLVY